MLTVATTGQQWYIWTKYITLVLRKWKFKNKSCFKKKRGLYSEALPIWKISSSCWLLLPNQPWRNTESRNLKKKKSWETHRKECSLELAPGRGFVPWGWRASGRACEQCGEGTGSSSPALASPTDGSRQSLLFPYSRNWWQQPQGT